MSADNGVALLTVTGSGALEPPIAVTVTDAERLQTAACVVRQKLTDVSRARRSVTDTPGVSTETLTPRRF
jgi:hypothetical protein